MDSIRLKNKYFDTTGIYDSSAEKTQDEINATQDEINIDLQFVDNLDIRTPLMYLCDVGYTAVQGLCCVKDRYIIVGRYTRTEADPKDLMVFDIVQRKVIKSNIFSSGSQETGKNVELGHLSSITYDGTYLYIPRSSSTDGNGDILRLTFNATTGDISLDGEFTYVAPEALQNGDKTIPYKPLCLAYAGGDFYYIASTTKSNRCYIYKISDDFSTTELAFTTNFDGISAGHFARQGFTTDGKYLYFSLSGGFNVSKVGTDIQYAQRSTQEIIITDLNGTVVKSLTFPRGEYGEIEDIDLITPPGSTTPSIVIACNRNDSISNFAPVYACPLYRNSKKSFYLLTQDSEGSLLKDSNNYRVYCDSSPCYIDTSGNATTTYNVLNSNPFATGLVQDKFTSIPAAIGYIKKLGFPVTLYISGKHGNMNYRGLRGINFVFDETVEIGDINIEDSYGISLTFEDGATHGTVNTGNSVLYGNYEKARNAVNAITSHGEVELSLNLTAGSYWNLEENAAVLGSNASWSIVGSSDGIPVQEGEEYTITACQGNTARTRIWAVTDDSFNILAKAPDFQNNENKKFTSFCRIPVGGTKLLVTGRTVSYVEAPAITISKISEQFMTEYGEPIPVEFTVGGLYDSTYLARERNDRIRVIGKSLPLMQAGSIISVKYPYSATILASKSARYADSVVYTFQWLTGDFIVPEEYNGYYWGAVLRKVGHESDDISADIDIISDYIQFIPKLSAYEIARRKLLSGKKLSVMGDSMSAMEGYIPSGNAAYYKNSNQHGVYSASQMWWSVLCKLTGMTPLVINAWSGSGVTHLEESNHDSITEMSHDSRCAGLGTSNDDPDVIIIAGGTNDYSWSQSAHSEPGSWDGKAAPVLGNSFIEAYACMIKKIRDNYPNAIIVCLSTWWTKRGTFNGYTYTHTVGNNDYTQADYDTAIENVCKIMRVPYINVNNVGFNAATFDAQYASGDSTPPAVHLDARGHYVIGKCIAEKIIPLVIGLKNNDYFKYTTS